MKIVKFNQFILEEVMNDTPESYVNMLLKKLKVKIDNMFEYEVNIPDEDEVMTIQKAKQAGKKSDNPTFKEFNLRLDSSDISTYSKMYDSLTVKFSDDENTYTMIIMVDIKDALPNGNNNNNGDFSVEDIKKCYVKFKKYDLDTFEIIGQITKNIEVNNIDEDFIIGLKIEVDDEFGTDEEEFEIET